MPRPTFTFTNWENQPETVTPINANALNSREHLFVGFAEAIAEWLTTSEQERAEGIENSLTAAKAGLVSPAFTGNPTAPTQLASDNSTHLATTAYVTGAVVTEKTRAETAEGTKATTTALSTETSARETADNLKAPLASPAFTGTPTMPTATAGTNTTQGASTAFVTGAVNSEKTRAEAAEALKATITSLTAETSAREAADNLKAPLASPAFTGIPTMPTATAGTNTTQGASTAFVTGAVATETSARETADNLKAPLASPTLTGTPAAPTAVAGTNTTQIASTAFATGAVNSEKTRAEAAETALSALIAVPNNPVLPEGIAFGLVSGGNTPTSGDATTMLASKIKWSRTELQAPVGYTSGGQVTPLSLNEKGFKVLGILGNVPRSEKVLAKWAETAGTEPGLAQWVHTCIRQAEAASAYCPVFECGNEMYSVGTGSPRVYDPVSYGRMYVALANALWAAGFRQPLLFNMAGDYQNTSSTFSYVVEGHGWLSDALAGNEVAPVYAANGEAPASPTNPKYGSLRQALLANAYSIHPYNGEGISNNYMPGKPTSLTTGTVSGANSVAIIAGTGIREQGTPMKGSILTLLGSVPPCWITEYGANSGGSEANLTDKANQIRACIHGGAYLPSGTNTGAEVTGITGWIQLPYVRGIFVFNSYSRFNSNWGVWSAEPGAARYVAGEKFAEMAAAYGS